VIELTSGRMRLTLDPATGTIHSVTDTAGGVRHLRSDLPVGGPVGLFRIVSPTDTWWSRYADADEQPPPEVAAQGGRVTLRYADLRAHDGEPLGVSAELRIETSERPDELLVTLALHNLGPAVINEVRCPWMSGWSGIGDAESDRIVLGGHSALSAHRLPTASGNTYARNHQREWFEYPVRLYAPWVDISGPGGGLALINYMRAPENGAVCFENLAGYGAGLNLALGWAHMVSIGPGERWTSPPMGISVHADDWHATADRYREWFDAVHPPDSSRMHLRSAIGFQNLLFRGFDGTPVRPLEEIPAVAEVGRRFGVDHLCVWDTLTLGNYAKQCDRDLTDYPADERELLRAGLTRAEQDGTRTSALINFRHPVAARAVSDPAVQQQVIRRFDGTFRTENWSASHNHGTLFTKHLGPESWVYSPFSAEHRERVMRITRDYLDLGYTSMFYDQPFEIAPDYGVAGSAPERTHHAALEMIREVRRKLLAGDPDAIVIGEECDVFAQDAVDLWMSWATSQPSAVAAAALTRYSIPHTMLSWVIDHEPERVALAFALGMQMCLMIHGGEGTLADVPELAELVGRMAALRARTAERTTCARFADTVGLQIDGDDSLVAFGYDSPDGPAVIVAAPGAAASGSVTVDRDAFSAPGDAQEGRLFRLDGTDEATRGDRMEFSLAANEAAVWTL